MSGNLSEPLETTPKPIRVVLADDHHMVREGLCLLLQTAGDIQIVGEGENDLETVRLVKERLPDVVIVDLAMPVLDGLQSTWEILGAIPTARVLMLSSYYNEGQVRDLLNAGVMGYLTKQTTGADLIKAIRAVHGGQRCLSPCLAKHLVSEERDASRKLPRPTLTRRETEVVELIAESYCNKQIASELGISIKTVEKHRNSLMMKLNLHEVAGLTRYAVTQRLIAWPTSPK